MGLGGSHLEHDTTPLFASMVLEEWLQYPKSTNLCGDPYLYDYCVFPFYFNKHFSVLIICFPNDPRCDRGSLSTCHIQFVYRQWKCRTLKTY